MRIASLFFLLFLTGCATTWHNNKFSTDEAKETQLKKDTGYCRGVSYGAVPMPDVRIYDSQQQSYNIQGTATSFNSQTGFTNYNYSGTATPYSSGFAGGMASGMASGLALGAAIRANNEREEVFNACMMNLGWSDKPIVEATKQIPDSQVQTEKKQNGDWMVLICRLYKDYKTPGAFDEKYKSTLIINAKQKTIETQSKKNLVIRGWTDNRLIVSRSTDKMFDTKPPIEEHIVEIVSLTDGRYTLSAAYITEGGIPLDENELRRVAGGHPMWKKREGIVPWTAYGSCE